jgi:prevent-host-death family protein
LRRRTHDIGADYGYIDGQNSRDRSVTDYSVAEAKDKLSSLIDKAEAGEPVVITRHGKPVVELRRVTTSSLPSLEERRAAYERQIARRNQGPWIPITSVELLNQMYDDE